MVTMAATDRPTLLTLASLEAASISSLRQRYTELYGRQPPKWASLAFLRGSIAWAMQARGLEQDPATLRSSVQRTLTRALGQTAPRYREGTRLVREWQGEVYEVTILPKGYLWQGQVYRSLSRIAHEITGAKWSGPRFFGLKAPDS